MDDAILGAFDYSDIAGRMRDKEFDAMLAETVLSLQSMVAHLMLMNLSDLGLWATDSQLDQWVKRITDRPIDRANEFFSLPQAIKCDKSTMLFPHEGHVCETQTGAHEGT